MNNNNNEELAKDMIEGVSFVLWVVGIIGMACLLYEVNELQNEVHNLKNLIIRK
jgi:hypothetical protein